MTLENMTVWIFVLSSVVLGLAVYFFHVGKKHKGLMDRMIADSAMGMLVEAEQGLKASQTALELLGLSSLSQLEDIASLLSQEESAIFSKQLSRLKERGEAFTIIVSLRGLDQALSLQGQRLETHAAHSYVIWVVDQNDQQRLKTKVEALAKTNQAQSDMLNLLPMPVWRRDRDDLSLSWVNKAYSDLLDIKSDAILQDQVELGAGSIAAAGRGLAKRVKKSGHTLSESHAVALQGKRRLLDFTEMKSSSDDVILGFAEDRTSLDDLQSQLATHLAAHDEVLDDMTAAISIFGPDRRLIYNNQSFTRMFDLQEAELEHAPSYGEILEVLRSRRQLPEVVDFPNFKREQESQFNRLIGRKEEMLHLPDGRILHQLTFPHPLGGLMFVLEDVTDLFTLESNFNTQIAVQQATLNNLHDAVSVWGSDGRLKIWNKVFENYWGFGESQLLGNPHLSKILAENFPRWFHLKSEEESRRLQTSFVLRITERMASVFDMKLKDGRVIHTTLVPLPDAQVLLIHSDITDSKRVEQALEERNVAFERADMLKSQFLSNISYELRTPINAIQGFASILKEEFYGSLNPRQRDHVENILDAGDTLTQLVKDILDLAIIQADLMDWNREEVNLNGLIQSSVTATAQLAKERDQQVIFDALPLSRSYFVDPEHLERAFSNLLDTIFNITEGHQVSIAIDETDAGCQIHIQTDWVIEHLDDQEMLLRRFVGNDPHALSTGVGLNLSLAKNLLALHGGRLEADVASEEGLLICILLEDNLETE